MDERTELLKKLKWYRDTYTSSYDTSNSINRLIQDLEHDITDDD